MHEEEERKKRRRGEEKEERGRGVWDTLTIKDSLFQVKM
jgi:hypothetical protein